MSILITGISGQDGSYLAELVLGSGATVFGTSRDITKAHETVPPELRDKVQLLELDLCSQSAVTDLISECRPRHIYNFAAYSSGTGMYDDPLAISEVNGLAVTRILEAIRTTDPTIRLCQASSREVFGEAHESPQTEATITKPRSPYGTAKLYADNMIRIYRQRFGLFACSAILFNHESPRRGLAFVTRKITRAAAEIKLGLSTELKLGNLDALRDWVYAGDAVRAMYLMLQQNQPDDYVIASGEVHSVRDFCHIAFDYLDLDYRQYVREDETAFRPSETVTLVGNAEKAHRQLGWFPKVPFRELVCMMVESDLCALMKQ